MYLNSLNLTQAEYQKWYATGIPPKRYSYLAPQNQGLSEDRFDTPPFHSTSAQNPSHLTLGSLFKTALYGGIGYLALKHFAPQTFSQLASMASSASKTAFQYANIILEKGKTLI